MFADGGGLPFSCHTPEGDLKIAQHDDTTADDHQVDCLLLNFILKVNRHTSVVEFANAEGKRSNDVFLFRFQTEWTYSSDE